MDDKIWRQGLAGAVCIGAGVLLLGSQAGWWTVGSLARWWPLGLVAFAVPRGLTTREGFLLAGWGGLLLVWSTQIVSWRATWPVVLVMYGVAMMIWPSGRGRGERDGSRVG